MSELTRRKFVAGGPAAAVLAASTISAERRAGRHAPVDPSQLAINGGKPVRSTLLRAGYFGTQYYDEAERRALEDVLNSGSPFRWYGPGPNRPNKVLNFEREFAKHQGTKYALAVTSGTSALMSALGALEIGPGDEVVLPAWTWHSCYNAVVLHGALPVFAEIDESFNLDPQDVERKITPRTKVVMVVHLLGGPADLDPILEIARRRKLRVLEDCAQCVGGSYKSRPLGSLADIGMYSFQLNKTITAGEGGAVVTSDPVLFERATRFHDLGGLRPPHQELLGKPQLAWFVGGQYRMSEFTGAVMGAQLTKLDTIVAATRRHARRVREAISDLPGLRLRRMPDAEGDIGYGVFFRASGRKQRDQVIAALKAENINAGPISGSVILPTQPHIERKVTLHPGWPPFNSPEGKAIRYGAECCPQTLAIHESFIGVHLHPKFTEKDVDDVIAGITKVYMALVAPRV